MNKKLLNFIKWTKANYKTTSKLIDNNFPICRQRNYLFDKNLFLLILFIPIHLKVNCAVGLSSELTDWSRKALIDKKKRLKAGMKSVILWRLKKKVAEKK